MGFEGRTRSFSILKDGSYFYGRSNREDAILRPELGAYAIMLPGFFVHRAYLEMLFDPVMVPAHMLDYVNTVMNCDDILFSMMLTRFLRRAELAVTAGLAIEPAQTIRNLHFRGKPNLSRVITSNPNFLFSRREITWT